MSSEEIQFKTDFYKTWSIKEYYNELSGEVEGYAAVFGNIDRQGDIIEKGAFTKTLSSKPLSDIKVLFHHDPAYAIGTVKKLYEDDYGLRFVAQIMDGARSPAHLPIVEMIKKDVIKGVSVGFNTINKYTKNIEGRLVNVITDLDLMEFSFVSIQANEKAKIDSIKSIKSYIPTFTLEQKSIEQVDYPFAPLAHEWDKTEANYRWRKYSGSEEKPSESYKDAFLYYNKEKKDEFTAYHLQIVDIVDGKPMIVPKALSAVVTVIHGGRGGLKVVPESEIEKLKGEVAKLYKKMDKSDPFAKTRKEFLIEAGGWSEIDYVLKNYFGFSDSESSTLIQKQQNYYSDHFSTRVQKYFDYFAKEQIFNAQQINLLWKTFFVQKKVDLSKQPLINNEETPKDELESKQNSASRKALKALDWLKQQKDQKSQEYYNLLMENGNALNEFLGKIRD